MGIYSIKKSNGGLFVVLELRNRRVYREEIEKDRQVLISMAKRLNVKSFYYEQFKNDIYNRNTTEKKFSFNAYLSLIQSYANEYADEIDYLMLFVLAECENVESSIKFEFFDDNSDFRVDICLYEVLRPFLGNVCEGLNNKPKIVMIHAPEKVRYQITSKAEIEGGPPKRQTTLNSEIEGGPANQQTTPNHADFYICISRPFAFAFQKYRRDILENYGTEPRFLLLLYSILEKFPDYEINQVMSVLQRETMDYHKKIIGQADHSLRLWNCSKLLKKLYLFPQMDEETESTKQTSGEHDKAF